jgi:hypothetical protein
MRVSLQVRVVEVGVSIVDVSESVVVGEGHTQGPRERRREQKTSAKVKCSLMMITYLMCMRSWAGEGETSNWRRVGMGEKVPSDSRLRRGREVTTRRPAWQHGCQGSVRGCGC